MSHPITIPALGEVSVYHDKREAFQAFLVAEQARKEGHAVVAWAVYEHDGKFEDAFVLHYRTCRHCAARGEVKCQSEGARSSAPLITSK
jgi:hypothetical protein